MAASRHREVARARWMSYIDRLRMNSHAHHSPGTIVRNPPRNDDLPDGIIPLPPEEEPRTGCGLLGCLYGTMIVFSLLLLAMVALALLRRWQVPMTIPGLP